MLEGKIPKNVLRGFKIIGLKLSKNTLKLYKILPKNPKLITTYKYFYYRVLILKFNVVLSKARVIARALLVCICNFNSTPDTRLLRLVI